MFSEDRIYRYQLRRDWDETLPVVAFIGLNPSTADETQDDPTIRRCIGFAKAWGYGGLVMLNLFAFRATDPKVMRAASDPIGPDNNVHICAVAKEAEAVVAAWGTGGAHLNRDFAVRRMLHGNIGSLGFTNKGHPRHPLYVPASQPLLPA